MAREGGQRHLICWGDLKPAAAFTGETDAAAGVKVIPCDLTNLRALHAAFPFTAPVPVAHHRTTFGTGDRLGLAAPGHVRAVRGFDAVPVLAQQSKRELNLTGRTFPEVIAAASYGVFQEHFTRGYGADADHVKTEEEVAEALRQGATMITLDASERLDAAAASLPIDSVTGALDAVPANWRHALNRRYLETPQFVGGAAGISHLIQISPERLARTVLVYGRVIKFAIDIWERHIAGTGRDFELSIDETPTPTDPAAHYIVARELQAAGVEVTSIAPRFCGDFQKGIEYIGDTSAFEREFDLHAAIADELGHKLSIHSGSDKFSVFPIIGKYTGGRLHHKTAGTSWLEALRVVAGGDPGLFREIHACARAAFGRATAFYHVRLKPGNEPTLPGADSDLPGVLDNEDHRQLLHITYGAILVDSEKRGLKLKTRLFELLDRREEAHAGALEQHIGRHLKELGIAPRKDT